MKKPLRRQPRFRRPRMQTSVKLLETCLTISTSSEVITATRWYQLSPPLSRKLSQRPLRTNLKWLRIRKPRKLPPTPVTNRMRVKPCRIATKEVAVVVVVEDAVTVNGEVATEVAVEDAVTVNGEVATEAAVVTAAVVIADVVAEVSVSPRKTRTAL